MANPGRLRIQVRLPVRVRVTVALAATAAVAVVSGCATLPSDGAPQQVTGGGNQVQAYVQPLPPPGPSAYHQPQQVVLAFLHASASYAFDPAAARQFLLPSLRRTWHPGPVTVVSSDIRNQKAKVPPHSLVDESSAAGPVETVVLTGQRLATLSQTGQYEYSPGTRTYQFSLQRVGSEWLIAALPSQDSLLLTQADFEHVYQARSLFYFAQPLTSDDSNLVPDPVYAPLSNSDSALNINLASGLVRGLLNDRGSWVSGATATAFLPGTKLLGVTISGQTAVVNLGGAAVHATAARQEEMAEQLQATLGSTPYSPPLAHTVQLEINGRTAEGTQFPNLTNPVPNGPLVYESGPDSVSQGPGNPASIGPAQLGSADITAMAMDPVNSPHAGPVAIAERDGRGCEVFMRTEHQGQPTGPYRVTPLSTAGGDCTSLSWDSNGNLWAAAGRKIWVLLGQSRRWQVVALPAHLTPSGQPAPQILAMRMAPDGVRAALLIKSGDHSRLVLAAVRQEDGDRQVSLVSAVAAGTGLSDPMAVSWFSPYDLIVLDHSDIAEVPLAGGAAQRLSPAPDEAVSLTTNGVTIVVGTADQQILTSSPLATAPTTITWNRQLTGAIPIYPG
jgi:hypothetical protein